MNVKIYTAGQAQLLTFILLLLFSSCNKEESSSIEVSPTLTSVTISSDSFTSYNGETAYIPFSVVPADYPLTSDNLFMGVYDSQITKSISTEYPPFIDQFSVYELIPTGTAGEYLAGLRIVSGNYYADANIAIAIRQVNSAGEFQYFISSVANVTTKPYLSSGLIEVLPTSNSITYKNKINSYQSTIFNISAAELSKGSGNYYDISDLKVIVDSVYLSDSKGEKDTLDLFTLERLDDFNWKVSPKYEIEDMINSNLGVGASVRFLATDVITADTVEIVSTSTFFKNSLIADIDWTLDEVERFDFNQIDLSSYLSQLGITSSMLASNADIKKINASLSFEKSNGDSVDGYCEYAYIDGSDIPEAVEVKFYNPLEEAGDYVIEMNFEYGDGEQESFIQADLTINVHVTEVEEVTEQ
ncbi:MAG: hypothetical protein R3Y50_03465 [Rikenellaceae bacterium]